MTPPMSQKDSVQERDRTQERTRETDASPYTDTDLRDVWPDLETDDSPSRLGRVVERGRPVAHTLVWPVLAPVVSVFNVFRSSEARTAAYVLIAYATGIAGLAMSFVGDPTAANGDYGAAGIALMGITFACLFLLSVSALNVTGGRPHGRGGYGHGRRSRGRNGNDR